VKSRFEEAMLHVHGGWFNLGTAKAYRHLVAHIAARVGAKVFVPDYRLAPELPFPAAVEDVLSCYRGLDERVFVGLPSRETLPAAIWRLFLLRASLTKSSPPR
jgi:alpha/beta hydrolase fold